MSPGGGVGSPSPWVRPADVMRARLKARKRLLQARISATPLQVLVPSSASFGTAFSSSSPDTFGTQSVKRRNPFKSSPNKRQCQQPHSTSAEDDTTDATLFQLLNPSSPTSTNTTIVHAPTSFTNLLKGGEVVGVEEHKKVTETPWADHLPLDWCLKSRIRFRCSKPLPWKHNFKTSEEASGTTGFVRCLAGGLEDGGAGGDCRERTLDTSANAQFYQRCLVWQHPALPWLGTLFPRHPHKRTTSPGIVPPHPKMVEVLRAEWSESLRSLHQLLRVRQCPFFYVCGAAFTVLFRAAGVAGISQAHALITPTTRGLREAMRAEDIEFEMPFHHSGEQDDRNGKEEDEEEETAVEETVKREEDEETEEEEKGGAASWLKDLGVETSQFPNLNPNRAKVEREQLRNVDSRPSSLVYVEGMEMQALINFLINSKSCVPITGQLAGVPPTLLAPVAFQGATLCPLKAKGGVVRQGGSTQHSMEVSGPVLPHTVHQLAALLAQAMDSFSISLCPVASSLPFALHTHREATTAPQAFAKEGLVDCGLDATTRQMLCTPASPHSPLPPTYREVTCQAGKYTWTDQ